MHARPRPPVIWRTVAAGVVAMGLIPAGAQAAPRYDLANQCWSMRSVSDGRFIAKAREGGSYKLDVSRNRERYFLKPTALGRFLFHDAGKQLMKVGEGDEVAPAGGAEPAAEWKVREGPGGSAVVTSLPTGKTLAVSSAGRLVLTNPGAGGRNTLFKFERGPDCAAYPEIELNVSGRPFTGPGPFGEVRGLAETHMHMMGMEMFGGRLHCGRPWHPYGVAYALRDCPDHYPNGCSAIGEGVATGSSPCHDPVGWPTFRDWPHQRSRTHEQTYYRWLERTWRGGMRLFVNLFAENGVLCEVYPLKQNSCNEMDSVKLQIRRIREFQDYVDAQEGGPGKGWFRIVTDPFQARRVINEGKLAVVLGIEISRLFDCRLRNEVPQCDRAQIDRQLDEVYRLGVRQMELLNKFDNALGGVAGDSAGNGMITNPSNFYETGKFWQLEHCEPADGAHDHNQAVGHSGVEDAGLTELLPGATPVYPEPPHCNVRGLSDLGRHLVNRMMQRRMIIDPDHMSARARKQLLSQVGSKGYGGLISSHSWSTPDAYRRILRAGGVIGSYAGPGDDFEGRGRDYAREWKERRAERDPRFLFGFGIGSDINGFGQQPQPRNEPNPVKYPFKSFDGGTTFHRQRSGSRVFDVNTDGVAHYGMYPDWVEDQRKIAGNALIRDMANGAEAYLRMWERAHGAPGERCRGARARFSRRGLGALRLGLTHRRLLLRAGQPVKRGRRSWRYCVRGRANRRAKVVTVFTRSGKVGLVGSTAKGHRARRIGRGSRARRLRRVARRLNRRMWVRRARGGRRIVYGVRRGRVRYVAVVARSVGKSRRRIRAYVRLAKLR